MRKLILISVVCLASASAQAEDRRGLVLAGAEAPAAGAATDNIPQPLPPVSRKDSDKETAKETAKPQASQPSARPLASRSRPEARRQESDEAKARRIAAQYGIRW